MANGELFDEVRRILEGEDEIPARAANNLILAAQKELWSLFKVEQELARRERKLLAERVLDLEESDRHALAREERNLTWPWIKDNLIEPMIRTGLTLLLGYIFFRLFGAF